MPTLRGARSVWLRSAVGVLAMLAGGSGLLAQPEAEFPEATEAAIIPIHDTIDDIARDSIKRRIEAAKQSGATTLIFEMNTPGGLVTSARDISALIKEQPADVRTVAWVNPDAISAGALISVACRQIVMTSRSTIGDCAPIIMGGELGEVEREKIETVVRSEFLDSAQRNGHNADLLLAMVTRDRELWWLEALEGGERILVSGPRKRELIDDVAAEKRAWKLVNGYVDPVSKTELHVAQPLDSDKELLTLTQSQAVAYGLATGIADDIEALRSHLGLRRNPAYMELSGWEKFAAWLNNPVVRGLFLTLFLLGMYMEFQSPGVLIPGLIALLSLGVFLGAPYVAGLATIWPFILLGAGILLLAVEFLLFPGIFIAGLLGVGLVAIGLLFSFVPPTDSGNSFSLPSLTQAWEQIKIGILTMSGSVVAAAIGLAFLIRYFPRLPGGRQVVLATPDAASMQLRDYFPGVALVGDVGVVVATLRPGGQVRFGSELVDVQTEGEYVEAGRRVQVLRREGNVVVVRSLPHETTA